MADVMWLIMALSFKTIKKWIPIGMEHKVQTYQLIPKLVLKAWSYVYHEKFRLIKQKSKPVLSGPVLNGHSLLSGQSVKVPKIYPLNCSKYDLY